MDWAWLLEQVWGQVCGWASCWFCRTSVFLSLFSISLKILGSKKDRGKVKVTQTSQFILIWGLRGEAPGVKEIVPSEKSNNPLIFGGRELGGRENNSVQCLGHKHPERERRPVRLFNTLTRHPKAHKGSTHPET